MMMATKKAAKKAAKKATSARGGVYSSTGDGRKKFGELTGQGKIVADALVAAEPISAADLATKVANKLETKQDPKRVVGFYLSQWKTDGLVKSAKQVKA